MKTVIYHNNQCSKSRNALALIKTFETSFEVVEYLKAPPNKETLKAILKMLQIPASELIRQKESIFIENFKGKLLSEDEWIEAMVQFPKLIERPIVVRGNRAAIGRPVENVLELFTQK